MPRLIIQVTDEQLIALLQQLPAERRRAVIEAVSVERDAWWAATHRDAEAPLRALAAEKGLDWDRLGDRERRALADDMVADEAPVPLARQSKPRT